MTHFTLFFFQEKVWKELHMKLVHNLPSDDHGYEFGLIIMDTYSRWIVIKPLRTDSHMEISVVLYKLLTKYGSPGVIKCDMGGEKRFSIF